MTSPPREITVECPKCGLTYQDWYRASINLGLDDFDDDYVREATTAKCPHCGEVVDLGALIVDYDGTWRVGDGGPDDPAPRQLIGPTARRTMSYIMVDVESDGPIPGDYSMICFGAIVVEPSLDKTFYGKLKPISDKWIPEALAVSGFSREETLTFDDPKTVMGEFAAWLEEHSNGRPFFVSDNNGYDWQFINWYFHHFTGDNPFGFSSTNLGSLYKGVVRDMFKNFKHLRKTAHTHHPVDDAKGNAEAMLRIIEEFGLNVGS